MLRPSSWIDGLPRVAAAAILIAGVALLCRCEPGPRQAAALAEIRRSPSQGAAVGWDVRTGGWQIRVDEVALLLPPALPEEGFSPSDTPAVETPRLNLSDYDDLIIRHAEAEGFDWRLIAAIAFEESRFNPLSVSDKGAFGLMQVREIAARDIGESRYWLPEDNVRAGVRYLGRLRRDLDAASEEDRLRLSLAAYNVGPAHLRDAQQVATVLGLNPWRWEGVRQALPLLERPAVYSRVEHGFAKGTVTVGYVERVWRRFLDYQIATAASDHGAG